MPSAHSSHYVPSKKSTHVNVCHVCNCPTIVLKHLLCKFCSLRQYSYSSTSGLYEDLRQVQVVEYREEEDWVKRCTRLHMQGWTDENLHGGRHGTIRSG